MRLKVMLLATASVLVLAGSAAAADLPHKAYSPVAAPSATWSGFYVGVGVGGASARSDANLGNLWDYEGYTRPYADPMSATGIMGSLYAGYNWQTGPYVIGVEADGSYLGLDQTNYFNHVDSYYDGALRTNVQWSATFRGRLGYTVDNVMLYATGGLALANIRQSYTVQEKDIRFSREGTRTGWVVGGGVEYMLSRALMLRAEGLYHRFGGGSVGESGTWGDGTVVPFGATNLFVGRIGVALKF